MCMFICIHLPFGEKVLIYTICIHYYVHNVHTYLQDILIHSYISLNSIYDYTTDYTCIYECYNQPQLRPTPTI